VRRIKQSKSDIIVDSVSRAYRPRLYEFGKEVEWRLRGPYPHFQIGVVSW